MEIRESRELPQGNSGDSSTPAPEGAEGICPACYHPFDSCRHCEVVADLSPEDASAVVEGIAERLLAPVQRIVAEIRSDRDELLEVVKAMADWGIVLGPTTDDYATMIRRCRELSAKSEAR